MLISDKNTFITTMIKRSKDLVADFFIENSDESDFDGYYEKFLEGCDIDDIILEAHQETNQ